MIEKLLLVFQPTKRKVFRLLDRAKEIGNFDGTGPEDMRDWPDHELADDMIYGLEAFGGYVVPRDLLPYIHEWKVRNGYRKAR